MTIAIAQNSGKLALPWKATKAIVFVLYDACCSGSSLRSKFNPLASAFFNYRVAFQGARQAGMSDAGGFFYRPTNRPQLDLSKLSVAARPQSAWVPVSAPCIPEKQSYAHATTYKTQENRATGV